MSYNLEAVIANTELLATVTAPLPRARVTPLRHGLSLMPATEALLNALTPKPHDVRTDRTIHTVRTGRTVHEDDVAPAEGTPVCRALRELGIIASGTEDEFTIAGLGGHRDTEGWPGA
ncbi:MULTISPECIES: hypothetical protein [unclassified Streptomyces]|uniref:hypothetical protein n=1 Tax=unclassified Streptomyces TaxID=2593676 RepID=UPI00136D7833|nr:MULTISPECIES: hypothetical protein [unclassified Streptomyces]NEA03434.1 hypothetical protein [Streptomyces sp. SID10116]MYY83913.1 hypothetical protein [Streptomyces sp. SID335]MYZ19523.1 hypothetical protein [Streptomyces sp. SID337]NDZ84115.1 hypothetical protein [Streptomyces sp. SID10115]NEA05959.1 hypothetical protein [Streptomyces sp. SID10116]